MRARIEIERDYDISSGVNWAPAHDVYVWQFDGLRFAYLGDRRSSSWDGKEGRAKWTPRSAGLDGSFEELGIAIGSRIDPIRSGYCIWWHRSSHPNGLLQPTYLADVLRDSPPEQISFRQHLVQLEWPAASVDVDPNRGWVIREARYLAKGPADRQTPLQAHTGGGGPAYASVQTSKVENGDLVKFANLWIPTSIRETQALPRGRITHAIATVSSLSENVTNRFWEIFLPGHVVSRGGPPLTIGEDGMPQPASGGSNSAALIIAALGVGAAALAAIWFLSTRRISRR